MKHIKSTHYTTNPVWGLLNRKTAIYFALLPTVKNNQLQNKNPIPFIEPKPILCRDGMQNSLQYFR